MKEKLHPDPIDQLLSDGLAREADEPQSKLESLEDRARFAKARFKKLEAWIHNALIQHGEALDDGDRVKAHEKTKELIELGERYRLTDEAYRPILEEVEKLENELEKLARKWGVPADEKGWIQN